MESVGACVRKLPGNGLPALSGDKKDDHEQSDAVDDRRHPKKHEQKLLNAFSAPVNPRKGGFQDIVFLLR